MNNKKQVAFRFSEKTLSDIDKYKEENNISNRTEALEDIVDKLVNQSSEIKAISDQIIRDFDEKYNALFTRLRLGTNTADINSQIIIEILNSIIIANNFEDKLFPTSLIEAETVKLSSTHIRNIIAERKQKKDNKASKN